MNHLQHRKWKLLGSMFLGLIPVIAILAVAQSSVKAGTVIDLNGLLPNQTNTGAITGTVMAAADGNGIFDIQVCANEYYTNQFLGCEFTDMDGHYTLNALDPGVVKVFVEEEGWAFTWFDGNYNRAYADPVTVTLGTTTGYIDFTLEPGGSVSGRVVDTDGNGVGNILVNILANGAFQPGYRLGTCTNQDGYYRIRAVPFDYGWEPFAAQNGNCGNGSQYALQYWDHTYDPNQVTLLTVSDVISNHVDIDFTMHLDGDGDDVPDYADLCPTINASEDDANYDGCIDAHSTVIDPATPGTIIYTETQGITTTIEIPTGAVTDSTTIVYTEQITPTAEPPSGLILAGPNFKLNAFQNGNAVSDFNFLQPTTITIQYGEISNIDENSLLLMYWNADQLAWQDAACGPYNRHLAENWFSVPICHLSEFALFGLEEYKIYLPMVTKPYILPTCDDLNLPVGTIEVAPAPGEGFYWPYFLYLPDNIQSTHILVVPNNSSRRNDDFCFHRYRAFEDLQWIANWADTMGTPLLIPIFGTAHGNYG